MKEGLKISMEIVTGKIKAIDRYSRVITFTYKNKDSFGAIFDGFVSVARWIYPSLQIRGYKNLKNLQILSIKYTPYNYFLWKMGF